MLTQLLPYQQAILAVLKTHPDNVSILKQACSALGSIARNTNNQVAIAAAGGIAVCIAAFRYHLFDPSLCLPLTSSLPPPVPTTEVSMTPDLIVCPNANSNKNETQIHPTLTKSSLSVNPIFSKLD